MSDKFDGGLYDVVMFDGREKRVTGPFRSDEEAYKHKRFLERIQEYEGSPIWVEMRI